jgi:hypothetical protein
MSEPEWPKTIIFTADAVQYQFASRSDLQSWLNDELQRWSAIIPRQSWSPQLNENAQHLSTVSTDVSAAALQNFANHYRPSRGLLGKFISRIQNPPVKLTTFNELVQAGSSGDINDYLTQGRTLAALYQAIGGKLLGLEQADTTVSGIQQTIQQVLKLRDSDAATTQRYNDLVVNAEADWKNRIEGYDAKVALKAPKTYWTERAAEHKERANKCRLDWDRWVYGVAVFIMVALVANISVGLPDKLGPLIAAVAERTVAFVTLLGIAVWFLRQKLRRLHMHEHFAEDAAERATMVETYAAMRGAGLQDADFAPILAALYRPGAAGPSEDHGPSLPWEIFARALGAALSKKG